MTKKASKAKPRFLWDHLVALGYERLDTGTHPDVYQEGNSRFPTYRKDGVRIALRAGHLLATHRRDVIVYMGEESDVILSVIIVDPEVRGEGRAGIALADFVAAADAVQATLYLEPTPLKRENCPLSAGALRTLYAKFGFEATDGTQLVMNRLPT